MTEYPSPLPLFDVEWKLLTVDNRFPCAVCSGGSWVSLLMARSHNIINDRVISSSIRPRTHRHVPLLSPAFTGIEVMVDWQDSCGVYQWPFYWCLQARYQGRVYCFCRLDISFMIGLYNSERNMRRIMGLWCRLLININGGWFFLFDSVRYLYSPSAYCPQSLFNRLVLTVGPLFHAVVLFNWWDWVSRMAIHSRRNILEGPPHHPLRSQSPTEF